MDRHIGDTQDPCLVYHESTYSYVINETQDTLYILSLESSNPIFILTYCRL